MYDRAPVYDSVTVAIIPCRHVLAVEDTQHMGSYRAMGYLQTLKEGMGKGFGGQKDP